jgi:thiamine pyrophosphate-dependent acetolactate synthase large subunit-like protein
VAAPEKAERPVLIVGSQLRWSRDEGALADLLARYPMPTFVNGMARGALPLEHPCLFSRSRRAALAGADVVLMCGTPFDFRVDYGREPTWSRDTKIIKVDRDATRSGTTAASTWASWPTRACSASLADALGRSPTAAPGSQACRRRTRAAPRWWPRWPPR